MHRMACILYVSILLCQTVWAAQYYVSGGGKDTDPGTLTQPWLTLQHAADNVSAGDTVIVRGGTYVGFKSRASGTQGAPITFVAYSGEQVVLNSPSPVDWHGSIVEVEGHDWWVVDGFEVTGSTVRAGIDVRVADHVTIKNCYAHHNYKWGIFTAFTDHLTLEKNVCTYSADEHGIYVSNSSDDCIIQYNTCHDNNASGIQINADPLAGGDGISSNCVVSHNRIYNNGSAGGAAINLASVRNSLIANNLIYNNLATGIAGWDDGQGTQWGTRDNRFYNNTVHQPPGGRWALGLKNGSTGNRVMNNILLHDNSGRGGLELDSSSLAGIDSNYNIMNRIDLDESGMSLSEWQDGYAQDPASFTGELALIFTPAAGDYHLFDGSIAVDRGATLADIPDDLENNIRPQGTVYDIGAYEYELGRSMFNSAPVNVLLLD
ncbi:MAG: hypothetical protein D3926_11270 [Desulfobacteraceae bacterium]|nr:MAG: hypothetical protein D3926_11270 [Desulfobacteraceae bacterium]